MSRERSTSAIPARTAVVDVLTVTLLWCLSVLVVNPLGNFPLNDDWCYGQTVQHLLATGDYRPGERACTALLTNVLWGSLFCVFRGFSFTALRFSTLALAWLGVVGTYVLVRELRGPRWLALVASLSLGANPIYYALSHSFMTDVPFTAIVVWTAVFFARHLRTASTRDLVIATALSLAGTLSRQVAVAVPVAFAAAVLLTRARHVRDVLRAVVPALLCVAALVLLREWLAVSGRLPRFYDLKTTFLFATLHDVRTLVTRVAWTTLSGALYLGLFLLPVTIPVARGAFASQRRLTTALFAATVALLIAGCFVLGALGRSPWMPVATNVLDRSGIGPFTLRDTAILGLRHVPELPRVFWLLVTVASVLGAGLLVPTLAVWAMSLASRAGRADEDAPRRAVGVFLLLSATIYLLLLTVVQVMDRYWIPAVPLLAAGIAHLIGGLPRARAGAGAARGAAVAVLAVMAIFAVGGTRDYLAWNRLRWRAVSELVGEGRVGVADVDGGYEVNGWYLYDSRYPTDGGKSWWWVRGDTYLICFGEVPGYQVVRRYRCQGWLPPAIREVVVLRKRG